MTRAKNELLFSIIATSIVCHSLLLSVCAAAAAAGSFFSAPAAPHKHTYVLRVASKKGTDWLTECEKCLLSLSLLLQSSHSVFHLLIPFLSLSAITPDLTWTLAPLQQQQ